MIFANILYLYKIFSMNIKNIILEEIENFYLHNKFKEITNSNDYINCHSFAQRMLNFDEKRNLPKLNFNVFLTKNGIKNIEKLQCGDLLEFNNIGHYAVYVNDGNVMEVEGWGKKPRIKPLIDLLNGYEGTTSIYRKTQI